MNLKLDDLIKSGNWYQVECSNFQGKFKYRLCFKDFYKVNFSEIDQLEHVFPNIDYDNVVIWLLQLNIANFCKKPMDGWSIKNSIMLVDNDGFKFRYHETGSFEDWSDYAKNSGMVSLGGLDNLNPKIKFLAAIPFNLPVNDDAEYSIEIVDGKISEI